MTIPFGKKRKDTDEISNEVRGYSKKEAVASQPQSQAGSAPWRR